MAAPFSRTFTLIEANRTLQQLMPRVKEMMAARTRLVELQPSLAPVLQKLLGNGGSRISSEVLETFERLRAAVRAIEAEGVLVKDLETGLLDFPSEREGEVVFLCWRYGEPAIAYWHPVDAGFTGRQPL
jgi:hypothetical protein